MTSTNKPLLSSNPQKISAAERVEIANTLSGVSLQDREEILKALQESVQKDKAQQADPYKWLNTSPSQEPTEKGSYWSRVKKWWSDKTTMTHALNPEDRSLLERGIDTVKAVPGEVVNSIASMFKLPQFADFSNMQDFFLLLSKVAWLTSCYGHPSFLVAQAALALEYGFLTTLVLDGIAMFVRMAYSYFTRPVDQADGDKEMSDLDKTSWYDSTAALFSALHYYTIGQLPSVVPRDVISSLVATNVVFTFARGIEHFGPWILKMIKGALNAIWRLATGVPYYDADQHEAVDTMAALSLEFDYALRIDRPNAQQIRTLQNQHTLGTKAVAIATARGVEKPVLERFDNLLRKVSSFVQSSAATAQYDSDLVGATEIMIRGLPAKGKSTIMPLIFKMIGAYMEYPGVESDWIVPYNRDTNFPATFPRNPKIVAGDDLFLDQRTEEYSAHLHFIKSLNTAKPVPRDAASVEAKERDFYSGFIDFFITSENIVNTDAIKATSILALARSFDGGIHTIILNPDYSTNPSDPDAPFDPRTLVGLTASQFNEAIADAFKFEGHDGVKRNLFELVRTVVTIHKEKLSIARSYRANVARLQVEKFVPVSKTFAAPKDFGGPISSFTNSAPVKEVPLGKLLPTVVQTSAPASAATYTSSVPSIEEDIEDQSFTLQVPQGDFDKFLGRTSESPERNKLVSRRAMAWMRASPDKWVFSSSGLKCDGADVPATHFWDMFVDVKQVDKPNLHVVPRKWDRTIVLAFKGEKFRIKKACCAHQTYCYRHGPNMCEAFDDDALDTDYVGLCHWSLENPDLFDATPMYFSIVSQSYAPSTWDLVLGTLKATLIGLSVAGVVMMLGNLLSRLWNREGVADQAYSKFAAPSQAPRSQLLKGLTFPGRATDQALSTDAKSWLEEKLEFNNPPCRTLSKVGELNAQLLFMAGNYGYTVGHIFVDGTTHIEIGGKYGIKLPVHELSRLEDFVDSPYFQYIKHPTLDQAFFVIPRRFAPAVGVEKYLIDDDIDPASITGIVMATRSKCFVVHDDAGALVSDITARITPFALGDAVAMKSYTSRTQHQGLFVHAAAPTKEGWCAFACWTTNTRVGRGSRVLLGYHAGYDKITRMAIEVPITRQFHEDLISRVPRDALNTVTQQSGFPPTIPETDQEREAHQAATPNLLYFGTLPKSETQHQSGKNDIIPSRHYHALDGLRLYDPVAGDYVTVPPVSFGPSDCRAHEPAMKKFFRSDVEVDPAKIELLYQTADEVAAEIVNHAPAHLKQPRSEVFTIRQAINGISEWDIPALDMTKSPGFHPGTKPGHLGRSYFFEQEESGDWMPKAEFAPLIEAMTQSLLREKELPSLMVVSHLKPELRPLIMRVINDIVEIDGVKRSRYTNAFWCLDIVVIRRVTLLLPSFYKEGRGHNRTLYGGDLSGREGLQFMIERELRKFKDFTDAVTYDASQRTVILAADKRINVAILQVVFPWMERDVAEIPLCMSHIGFLIFGASIYLVLFGLFSGHPLTTPINCGSRETLGRLAWKAARALAEEQGLEVATQDYVSDTWTSAYGDDYYALHDMPTLDNFLARDVAATYGVFLEPANKEGVMRPHSGPDEYTMLKRAVWKDISGMPRARLDIKVLTRIHAFIHNNGDNRDVQEYTNCEQCVRESFHLGRESFRAVKNALNASLARHGNRIIQLDYEELYREWFNRLGKTKIVPQHAGHVQDQAAATFFFAGDQSFAYGHGVVQTLALGTERFRTFHVESAYNASNQEVTRRLSNLIKLAYGHKATLESKDAGWSLPRDVIIANSLDMLLSQRRALGDSFRVWRAALSDLHNQQNRLRASLNMPLLQAILQVSIAPIRTASYFLSVIPVVDVMRMLMASLHDEAYLAPDWYLNYMIPSLLPVHEGVVSDQSASSSAPKVDDSGPAEKITVPAQHSTLDNTQLTGDFTSAAVTKVDPKGNLESQAGLTSHSDAAALIRVSPFGRTAGVTRTKLNPFPPFGTEKSLEREYWLFGFAWNTADALGTGYEAFDPLLTMISLISHLQQGMSKAQYLRCDVEISLRVGGNQYFGGALGLKMVPYYFNTVGNSWRKGFDISSNGEMVLASASRADSVTKRFEWCSPTTWYNLGLGTPVNPCGFAIMDVQAQLRCMSDTPPTSIPVNVYGRLVNVQLAGPNPNISVSSALGGKWQPIGTHIRRVKDQSSPSADAAGKAKSDLWTNTFSSIKGVVSSVSQVAEMLGGLGLFDKPNNMTNAQAVFPAPMRDWVNSDGSTQSVSMSSPVNALVGGAEQLIPEAHPRPTWRQVLGVPGIVDRLDIPGNVAANTVLKTFVVGPRTCYRYFTSAGAPGDIDRYAPHPMAYFGGFHRTWTGEILFMIQFFSPSVQKLTVRILWFPDPTVTGATSGPNAGDALSRVVEITGDTFVCFPCPNLNDTHLLTGGISDDQTPSFLIHSGVVIIQTESSISSQSTAANANITGICWAAAGPGFSFACQNDMPIQENIILDGAQMSMPTPRFRPTDVHPNKVSDQSSARDIFGGTFLPLAETSPKGTHGIYTSDHTRGPIDMIKRFLFRKQIDINTGGSFGFKCNNSFDPIQDDTLLPICIPWTFWSGSKNNKFTPAAIPYSSSSVPLQQGFLQVRKWNPLDENDGALNPQVDGYGGTNRIDLRFEPVLSFTMPYTDVIPAREMIDPHDQQQPDEYWVQNFSNGSGATYTLKVDWFQAVGDDFALFIFHACPPITYTIPAGGRAAHKGRPSSKAAHKPVDKKPSEFTPIGLSRSVKTGDSSAPAVKERKPWSPH